MLNSERRAETLFEAAELNHKAAFSAVISLLADLESEELLAEPELGFLLANAYFRVNQLETSLKLLRDIEGQCRRKQASRLYRRRLNLEGAILLEFGDTTAAEARFSEVLHRATVGNDQLYIALATLNLGTAAGIRGSWAEALLSLGRAVTAFQLIGLPYPLAACHQNLAIVHRELSQVEQADAHLDQALELFHLVGSGAEFDVAGAECERALCVNALGDTARARAIAVHAIDRIRGLAVSGYPTARHEGEALRVLGLVLQAEGNTTEATPCLHQALLFSRVAKVRLLEGEVEEALAILARDQGHINEFELRRNQAISIYEHLGASSRASRLRALTVPAGDPQGIQG